MRTISRIPSAILLLGAAAVVSILPRTLETGGGRSIELGAPPPTAPTHVLAPLFPAPGAHREPEPGAGGGRTGVASVGQQAASALTGRSDRRDLLGARRGASKAKPATPAPRKHTAPRTPAPKPPASKPPAPAASQPAPPAAPAAAPAPAPTPTPAEPTAHTNGGSPSSASTVLAASARAGNGHGRVRRRGAPPRRPPSHSQPRATEPSTAMVARVMQPAPSDTVGASPSGSTPTPHPTGDAAAQDSAAQAGPGDGHDRGRGFGGGDGSGHSWHG